MPPEATLSDQTSSPKKSTSSDIILTLRDGITVRQYRHSDAASLAHHGNNKKIWNNLRNRMPHPYTEADSLTWITHCQNPANHVRSGPWTLSSGATGPALPTNYTIALNDEAIGSIGLEFGSETDIYARCAEVGYWLSEEHWGKSIMSAVVPAFVDWTWTTFGRLVRMNGEVWEANGGSRMVLEKAGFVVEGRRKWGFMKNGVLGDALILGMLRPGMEG